MSIFIAFMVVSLSLAAYHEWTLRQHEKFLASLMLWEKQRVEQEREELLNQLQRARKGIK
jgi:hypothetical protein